MDDRPRQVLKQLLTRYGTTLCDQPGRYRGLLLDVLQGACAAEVNTLFLVLQYGIVQDLRAIVGTRPPVLLLPQLVQKLRTRVPLDETATRWAIEAWAEALGLHLPAPLPSPPPPVSSPAPPVMSSPPPRPAPLPTWRNSIGMEFVLIQPGEFSMGSSASEADDDERPVHTVRLTNAFYLGKYEVTRGQWEQVMGNNPHGFRGGDKNLPVESVSWNDVQTFITTLNAKEGQQFYRLPIEAQWEYAARAGTSTAYSFGNDPRQLGEDAWSWESLGSRLHPVGQKKPNAWGLYDMHGNVWEWVQDWYGKYTAATAVDPAGPSSGSYRVYRGGGWNYDAGRCRVSYRGNSAPGPLQRPPGLGFRLLRSVK